MDGNRPTSPRWGDLAAIALAAICGAIALWLAWIAPVSP